MSYANKFSGSKKECLGFLKEVVNQIHSGNLVIEGNSITIPEDMDLDYKVKFAEDPGETKLTIKVKWPNDIPIPDVPEEDV